MGVPGESCWKANIECYWSNIASIKNNEVHNGKIAQQAIYEGKNIETEPRLLFLQQQM